MEGWSEKGGRKGGYSVTVKHSSGETNSPAGTHTLYTVCIHIHSINAVYHSSD